MTLRELQEQIITIRKLGATDGSIIKFCGSNPEPLEGHDDLMVMEAETIMWRRS